MNRSTGNPGDPAAEDVRTRIQRTLVKTFIALPLLNTMAGADAATEFDVIIDANLEYPGARAAAREWILHTLAYLIGQSHQSARRLKPIKNKDQPHYVFARLSAAEIRDLVNLDGRSNAELQQRLAADQAAQQPGAAAGLPLPLKNEPSEAAKDPHPWVPRAIHQIWQDFKVYPIGLIL